MNVNPGEYDTEDVYNVRDSIYNLLFCLVYLESISIFCHINLCDTVVL